MALKSNNLSSYKLSDILPAHELDLVTSRYREGLGAGTQPSMRSLLGMDSTPYQTIEKVVWTDNSMVFGLLVCSVCFILWSIAHIS